MNAFRAPGLKLLTGGMIAALVFGFGPLALAEEDGHVYHSDAGHFSLTLPSNFKPVNEDKKKDFMSRQDIQHPPNEVFEPGDGWPSMAIFVDKPFDIPDFDQFVEVFDTEMAPKFEIHASNEDRLDLTEVVNNPVYSVSTTNNGLYYTLYREKDDGNTDLMLVGMHPGRDELIQIYFIFPKDERNQDLPLIRHIVDSFHYDPGYALQ